MGDSPSVALIWPSRNFATESAREIANGQAFIPLVEDSFNFVEAKSRSAPAAAGVPVGCFLAARDFFLQQLWPSVEAHASPSTTSVEL